MTASPRKSPETIEKHLKAANWPSTKQDLVGVASRNDAPEDVIQAIKELPKERFDGPKDVKRTYANSR